MTGPTGGWGKEGKRVGAVTPALTSRAAVTPRPVFLRPPSVTGAGHGSRIGLRALILSHATFRCVGADDLVCMSIQYREVVGARDCEDCTPSCQLSNMNAVNVQ